jgi:hypothetical protein
MAALTSSTDCLVLKIEEYVDSNLDTTLFVLYDKNEETYLIRGKRSDINESEAISYSFKCYYPKELNDFISFIICPKSKLSYTLLNYYDLPCDEDNIDYNYLKNLDSDKLYEISGYDNQQYNKKKFLSILKFLKYVFNYY